MASVLVIGSSLIDIFVHSDEFHLQQSSEGLLLCQRYGEKIDVSEFSLHTGGGGSNVAVGLARLGHAVRLVSELGKDAWADIVQRDLESEQVNTEWLISEKKEQTGGSIILIGSDGGRTVLVHRGAASLLDPSDVQVDAVKSAEWIHLSSISGQTETLQHIFAVRLDTGKTQLSWNPGKAELEQLATGLIAVEQLPVQVLILNRQEWELVATVQQALAVRIPEILITDGNRGGELIIAGQQQQFSIDRVASVDDTGAGDAFSTGYVAGRLADKPPLEAIKWAKANSRSVVQQVGAKPGLLRKSTLEQSL